jgi:hypothetical protein
MTASVGGVAVVSRKPLPEKEGTPLAKEMARVPELMVGAATPN